MKRKDYITEEKSSIEHIDELMSRVLLDQPAMSRGWRLLSDIPGELWSKIPSIQEYLEYMFRENAWVAIYLYAHLAKNNKEVLDTGLIPHIKELKGVPLATLVHYMTHVLPSIQTRIPAWLWQQLLNDSAASNHFNYILSDPEERLAAIWNVVTYIPNWVLAQLDSHTATSIYNELELDDYHDAFKELGLKEWEIFMDSLNALFSIVKLEPPAPEDIWPDWEEGDSASRWANET
jgi:hypothetical protein